MTNETDCTLEKAQAGDLDEVCALCRGVAAAVPASGWGEDYPNREILADDLAAGGLYKVVRGGKIVSIMNISPMDGPDLSDTEDRDAPWALEMKKPCSMGRFCVSPELQGHGMGRRIMAESLKTARRLGFDGVRFYAVRDNGAATHLYDSMGFRRAGETTVYGMDFIRYEMKL